MSVNLSEAQVPVYVDKLGLRDDIHTACINSPTNSTLSGPSDALDVVKDHLDQEGIFAHKVNTGVAYHSPIMSTIAKEYIERMGLLELCHQSRTQATLVSSVSAQVVAPELLGSPQYWVDNLVSPVRFSDAMQSLADAGPLLLNLPRDMDAITDIVEIGPHSALRRPIKDILSRAPPLQRLRRHTPNPQYATTRHWSGPSLPSVAYCLSRARSSATATRYPFLRSTAKPKAPLHLWLTAHRIRSTTLDGTGTSRD